MSRWGAALLAVLLGFAVPASAQSKSALSWVREPGAESCIGAMELGRRVERLVGPMLVSAAEGQVSVEGRIAPTAHGFVADITIADASGALLGTRQLKSEPNDCRAIDDKLAFVIAVAIDPNAALEELPGELSQEDDPGAALLAELRAQPTQPATAPPPVPPRPTAGRKRGQVEPRESATQPRLRIALEPGLALGDLPGPAVGATLGVGVAFGERALWLRGNGWLPHETVARGTARVRTTAFGFAAAVCPLGLRGGRWSGWLCPGAGVDLLAAQPVGFDGTTQHRWVFGPDLELRSGVELSSAWWLGLSAVLQSRWPRQQIGYRVDGALRQVYRTPVASARVGAVLELRF